MLNTTHSKYYPIKWFAAIMLWKTIAAIVKKTVYFWIFSSHVVGGGGWEAVRYTV